MWYKVVLIFPFLVQSHANDMIVNESQRSVISCIVHLFMPLHQEVVVFLQNQSSQRLFTCAVHSTKTSILSGIKFKSQTGLKLGGRQRRLVIQLGNSILELNRPMDDYDTKYKFSPMYCDKITSNLVGIPFFSFLSF